MKRAAIVIAVMGMAAGAWAQNDKPASPATPAAQTAGTPPAPQGKRPPQAKTQPEFDAYKAAMGLPDPAAREKAADDFAVKFPDSELRPVIYKGVMQAYQQANNADKMMDMAKKVLSYDADDPEALLGVAQVLAERTRESDLDKDQKLAEAKKNAEKALTTIETDIPTTGYPPEQIATVKSFLRSEAYAVLGTIAFNAKTWPDAEANLRKSIDAFPQQPDPIAVFRLAVALDMQSKYPEALKYVNQAMDLTKEDTATGKAVRAEKDRLTKLSGGAPAASTATPK